MSYQEEKMTRSKALAFGLFVDALLIVFWGVLQAGVDLVFEVIRFEGISELVFYVIQVVFATGTIIPVVCFVFWDIKNAVIQELSLNKLPNFKEPD